MFKHIAKFYLLDFNSAQEIVDKIISLFDFESIPSMKKGHRRSAKPRKMVLNNIEPEFYSRILQANERVHSIF